LIWVMRGQLQQMESEQGALGYRVPSSFANWNRT
jgi:hypothetical protein